VVFAAMGVVVVGGLISLGNAPGPPVIRVAGGDDELWALTNERIFMQGGDSRWWVSRDGGKSWRSAGAPSSDELLHVGLREQACTPAACYRLVAGRRIIRRPIGETSWRTEHERPAASTPPAAGAWRSDWVEERSIAAVHQDGRDVVAVAAGRQGALLRHDDGTWHPTAVGRSWVYRIRWWLLGISGTMVLLGGIVVDQLIRYVWRRRHT
jgi:hypothetical protein